MFEDEIKMEEKSSGIIPLLLVLALAFAIIGGGAYLYFDSKKALSPQEAATLVASILKAQGPATVHFHSGYVKPSVDEKPRDPHYRLLEYAGLLKLAPVKGKDAMQVTLTPVANATFMKIPDVIQKKELDGTTSYTVPLADRKLVQVSKVIMKAPQLAQVEYTWQWQPTKLGDIFDASGSLFAKLNTWDRSTLIQKYGADFYHAQPQTATIAFVRGQKGWKVYTE
jgi:hypothetical protein